MQRFIYAWNRGYNGDVRSEQEAVMQEVFSTVNQEGQITIPADMVERLGLGPGETVVLVVDDGQVKVARSESVVDRTAGALKSAHIERPPTAEEMRQSAADEIAEQVMKRMNG
jgi:AbrB family looped-hinge helix DNA binding protein